MPTLALTALLLFGLVATDGVVDPLEEYERGFTDHLDAQVEDRCSSIASDALALQIETMIVRQVPPASPPARISR